MDADPNQLGGGGLLLAAILVLRDIAKSLRSINRKMARAEHHQSAAPVALVRDHSVRIPSHARTPVRGVPVMRERKSPDTEEG